MITMADAFTFDLFRAMEDVNKIVPALLRGYGLNVRDNLEDIKQEVIADLFDRQEYLKEKIVNQSYMNAVIKHSAMLAMKPLLAERSRTTDHFYPKEWLRENLDNLLEGHPSVPTYAFMPDTLTVNSSVKIKMIVINHTDDDGLAEQADFGKAFNTLTEKQQQALTGMRTTPTERSAYNKALDRLFIAMNKQTKKSNIRRKTA